MICLGSPGHRRIGRHRWGTVGRAMVYGVELLQVVVCIHCDEARVKRTANTAAAFRVGR